MIDKLILQRHINWYISRKFISLNLFTLYLSVLPKESTIQVIRMFKDIAIIWIFDIIVEIEREIPVVDNLITGIGKPYLNV